MIGSALPGLSSQALPIAAMRAQTRPSGWLPRAYSRSSHSPSHQIGGA